MKRDPMTPILGTRTFTSTVTPYVSHPFFAEIRLERFNRLDATLQQYRRTSRVLVCLCGPTVYCDSTALCETKRLQTRYHAIFLGRTRYSMQNNNIIAKTAPVCYHVGLHTSEIRSSRADSRKLRRCDVARECGILSWPSSCRFCN